MVEIWADDYWKDSDFFTYGMYIDKDYSEFFNANNYVHSASLMLTNPSATGHLTEANYINFKS